MPAFEMTGTLKSKSERVNVTESFVKRDFIMVVDENSPYPQVVQLQLTQNNCDKIDRISIGELITVKFNIRGKEYLDKNQQQKVITNLDAWSILRPNENSMGAPAVNNIKPPTETPKSPQEFIDSNLNHASPADDLPF